MLTLRTFYIHNSPDRRVEARIAAPRVDGRDWYCECQIVGLPNSSVDRVYGVNSMQALTLAIRYFRKYICESREPCWTELEQKRCGIPYAIPFMKCTSVSRKLIFYVEEEIARNNAIIPDSIIPDSIVEIVNAEIPEWTTGKLMSKETFAINRSENRFTIWIEIPVQVEENWACTYGLFTGEYKQSYRSLGIDPLHVIVHAISSLRTLLLNTRSKLRWWGIESEDGMLPYYIPLNCAGDLSDRLAVEVEKKLSICLAERLELRLKRRAKRMRKHRRGY